MGFMPIRLAEIEKFNNIQGCDKKGNSETLVEA